MQKALLPRRSAEFASHLTSVFRFVHLLGRQKHTTTQCTLMRTMHSARPRTISTLHDGNTSSWHDAILPWSSRQNVVHVRASCINAHVGRRNLACSSSDWANDLTATRYAADIRRGGGEGTTPRDEEEGRPHLARGAWGWPKRGWRGRPSPPPNISTHSDPRGQRICVDVRAMFCEHSAIASAPCTSLFHRSGSPVGWSMRESRT
jgi:hypothetical protein